MTDQGDRGDSWQLSEDCPRCAEYQDHAAQVEDALAAAKASLIIARAELNALVQVLTAMGWGVA